jgi:hypothetical protein
VLELLLTVTVPSAAVVDCLIVVVVDPSLLIVVTVCEVVVEPSALVVVVVGPVTVLLALVGGAVVFCVQFVMPDAV